MIRYTYNHESAEVIAVECDPVGYPNKDERGETQYDNTHFATWEEAHKRLLAEIKASLSLGTHALRDVRETTARYTAALADDAMRLVKAEALKPAEVQHAAK